MKKLIAWMVLIIVSVLVMFVLAQLIMFFIQNLDGLLEFLKYIAFAVTGTLAVCIPMVALCWAIDVIRD